MIGAFPRHDAHVHSTFSDGAATIAENVRRAEALGLDSLTLVDHVRADTTWLPEYVATVDALRQRTPLFLRAGIEAKILNLDGDLDLPIGHDLADVIYLADHQLPTIDGPRQPRAVHADLDAGRISAHDVVEQLVTATEHAMHAAPAGVLAHLFSILPKVGLDERAVTRTHLERIADAARETQTAVELSERWACPGPRAVSTLANRGVRLLVSTDSHRLETLGRFTWCRAVWREVSVVSHHGRRQSVRP